MRKSRFIAPDHLNKAYYHCVSRIVNREFLLGEEEKGQFVVYMRMYERLYGLRILTYCIMSNHFHILIEVPKRPKGDDLPSDLELVARVRLELGVSAAKDLEWKFKHFDEDAKVELRESWYGRMWNISNYMKSVKQRFTQWYNAVNARRGTLWESRFRSVLVEGGGDALKSMAAYIDLNPLRAEICDDPKDYRWCGYGEALGGIGSQVASRALNYLIQCCDPNVDLERYLQERGDASSRKELKVSLERWRCYLFGFPESQIKLKKEQGNEREQNAQHGESRVVSMRKKVPREKVLEVLQRGGKISVSEMIQCKVRYFADGVVIGTKSYVEEVFKTNRKHFPESRKDGARKMRGVEIDGVAKLYVIRNLVNKVFS